MKEQTTPYEVYSKSKQQLLLNHNIQILEELLQEYLGDEKYDECAEVQEFILQNKLKLQLLEIGGITMDLKDRNWK